MSSSAPTFTHVWADPEVAERYKTAENASRPFCKIMVEKSGLIESTSKANVFDLATGTGALVKELYDAVPKEKWGNLRVLGGDISESMLESLKKRGESEGWTGLETQVIDGNNLDLPKESFTHIFISFAIFQLPTALPKLYEALKPGGFIAMNAHAALPWQPLLDRSIKKVNENIYSPTSKDMLDKMFLGKPWYDEKYLASQISAAGFKNVETAREKRTGTAGTPGLFVEVMQFPMKVVTTFWEEDKREEWLSKVNGFMLEEATKEASNNETGKLQFEFETVMGYGYKSA